MPIVSQGVLPQKFIKIKANTIGLDMGYISN